MYNGGIYKLISLLFFKILKMSSNDVRQHNFESESNNNFEINNKELLHNLNSQLKLNYFPGDQTKHIDYVIYYTEKNMDGDENSRANKKIKKRKAIRFKFFDELKSKEGFEIERIVKNEEDDETSNYMLLNCSFQRLLQEAERMSLVLPLKNVNFKKLNFNDSLINRFISIVKRTR
jgi:hypothetical protein